MPDNEPLLTYAQVGEIIGFSAGVVAGMMRRGELARVVLSPRKHRIIPADLRAFIAARRQNSNLAWAAVVSR
ncbi:hypothetical protein P3H15_45770 [Rhodococcus sp. T2V]|uniref:hypothetical protein n=1 Tax=Rhodococcus sp. T2V TaxID=3034164 RepID=UPI0023E17F2C|nr:hypothetical protein [Rhodococcus sp. T2V]MDF3312267.1 hypothetical protein [Rhodococcus sp. T2V]